MTETAVAVRTCPKWVKSDQGVKAECGTVLPKGQPECRNKSNHMYPFKTGLCAVGACEGIKKLSASGRPMKPCHFWKFCACSCHEVFDMMFSMSEMDRVFVDNSGWSPEHSEFKMPTYEERAAAQVAARAGVTEISAVIIESPIPDLIPNTYKHTFQSTPTGRAARGELESWVREFCDEYLVEKYADICSPMFVAEGIGKAKGINPPSSGAVDAVFKRWMAIGFALIAPKPTRFIGYTPDGVKLGLEAMKLRARDASKSKQSLADRGIRS